jgi:pyruvate/2-oxoglutarate dehydrogenase complex dihydrolipoamide dehydrogenase (E3) component
MKVMVEAERDRVLGAAIFGLTGDEVIHSILNLMYADAPWQVLRDGFGIHPTVSELLPTLMEQLEPLPEPAVTSQRAGGSG